MSIKFTLAQLVLFFNLSFPVSSITYKSLSAYLSNCAIPIEETIPSVLGTCLPKHGQKLILEDLPSRIQDWGSQGRGGKPWQFADDKCNKIYIDIFSLITKINKQIYLTPHDLFHAHLIEYNNEQNIIMIFHAKEYPSDLEPVKNKYQCIREEFSSTDRSFLQRNFLYVNSTASNESMLYEIKHKGVCGDYLAEDGINYLSEEKIESLVNGEWVGDVNLFLSKNIDRIKYKFYSGFSFDNSFNLDLEFYHTGYSKNKRIAVNEMIDSYILDSKTIFYFLTGI